MPPPPPVGGCHHYVVRKSRYCKMIVKAGASYCGEHLTGGEGRVPCPLDPAHSCPAQGLAKHLLVCNSRAPDTRPVYLVPGINKGDCDNCEESGREKVNIADISDDKLLELIDLVRKTFNNFFENGIHTEQLEHELMKEELLNKEYGKSVMKHHVQNSSLLAHLTGASLISDNTTFVEFGSGRAALSYWLGKALDNPGTCDMVLVDRASPRHKLDTRLKHETGEKEAAGVGVTRLRVDIGDLDLGRALVTSDNGPRGVVGVSKHLCGAATDLSLRCLSTLPSDRLRGLMIALCCHHRCDWSSFVGKQFLKDQGFTRDDFEILVSMTSWATCGFGRGKKADADEEAEHETDQSEEFHPNDRYSRMGLSESNREEIGRLCKRVLDCGRIQYLNNAFPSLSVQLKHYVSPEVSLENALLLCYF